MKIDGDKNHLNVGELREICAAFGLSTSGLKHQLIERIVNFTSAASSANDDARESTNRTTTSTQTEEPPEDNEQTQNHSNSTVRINAKWILTGFAFCVVAFLIYWFGQTEEKIEIVVKHPWLPWFSKKGN